MKCWLTILAITALSASAFAFDPSAAPRAEGGRSRADVIAETLHAIRTGTMPDDEKPLPFRAERTRADVKAELREWHLAGDRSTTKCKTGSSHSVRPGRQ